MKRHKVISMMVLTALAAGVLSGCGGSGDSASNEEGREVTLTWMNHTSEEAKIEWEDAVVAAFEEKNPGVKVDVQRMSYDDYIQSLQTKFASGDAPDMYYLESTYIQDYVDNGYMASLSDLNIQDQYEEGALDMLTGEDGNVYALPTGSSTMCVTYNKDVFADAGITELPKTQDEFYDVCQKLQDAGYTPIGAAYADTWCLMADIQADYDSSVLLNDGNAIVDVEARTTKFEDSDEWRGVLERIQERQQYCNDDPFGTDWDTVCTDIANGETAMTLNGEWAANNITAMNPDANLGVFALPYSDDSNKTLLAIQAGTEGLALNPEGENLEEAQAFAEFYCSDESADLYTKMVEGLCIIKDASMENSTGAIADILQLMENGGAQSLGNINHNFTNEYRDAVQNVVSEFLLKDMSVDEALAQLDSEFDRISGN